MKSVLQHRLTPWMIVILQVVVDIAQQLLQL